ncbi:hypothetical protein I302_101927 [Kwoniella bestiolae CBS 10118]|uniref:Sox C-terminal domain-containing protein n=1 Tax=Kwoniella bestiolae CBS 10118 TaxID=1296100 RepID=A0A1B9GDN9_9TREE|nr:hypothetical protein I302_00610 [Kwoniella bestiolae CBS 10118]OCF29115.1 hypothetical protein I302_00610 [Kwoniella bestiolae CBS 10118]
MEAVRPAQEPQQQQHQQRQDDIDQLPPPPEPFPLDQFVGTSSSHGVNGNGLVRSEGSKQNVRNYLSSVQQSCINALSSFLPDSSSPSTSLSESHSQLASALTDLLEVTYELDDLLPPSTNPTPSTIHVESFPDSNVEDGSQENKMKTSFNALTNLLEGLQDARLNEVSGEHQGTERKEGELHPAIKVVREELAWQRLESLSFAIISLSQGNFAPSAPASQDGKQGQRNSLGTDSGLPPSYEQFLDHHHTPTQKDSDNTSLLPSYHDIHSEEVEAGPSSPVKSQQPHPESPTSMSNGPTATREKMLQELDSLTSAIERLSSVAPRLHDQRVELKPTSRSAKVLGNRDGTDQRSMSKEEKIKLERQKMKELEEIWDKIERAHGKRRIRVEEGQRADGEGWEKRTRERFINRIVDQAEARRLEDQDSVMGSVDAELARARDLRDRDHFLRDLIDQSGERRLDDQDATIPRTSDRRASLIETLTDYSTSGRLHDQDSLPPTPRHGINGERVENPFELVTVQDFLMSGGPDRRRSLGGDALLRSSSGDGSVEMGRSRSNSVPLEDGLGKKSASTSGRNTPTAFKKFAGLVRRGSVQLGLKASNGFDMNNIAYVAEHQENLRSVQITLHGVGVSSNLELQVESTSSYDEGAIITSRKDPSVSIRISLPAPVEPGQSIIFVAQSLHLEAKLIAQSIPTSTISLLPTYPLSAPDLRNIQAKALCCTSCDRELSTLPFGNRDAAYKDLPSEHWAEMMEVWMCHNDPSFTARLAERTKEGFWPQNGGVLVGGSYLLVGQERVKVRNIQVEKGNNNEPWHIVSCHCGEVLGKQRASDNNPGSGTVRFSKWAVSLLVENEEDEKVEYMRFPLSLFIVSDMLELSQAHASHRFIVSDEETGERRVYIWLFNPSVKMSYARPNESSPLPSPLRKSMTIDQKVSRRSSVASSIGGGGGRQPARPSMVDSKILRASKIMYKVVEPFTHTENELESLPGFGPGGQVESLTYPSIVCERLIATLRESSTVYPIGRRSMGAFDVGFLERV